MKILIIDDEELLVKGISYNLEINPYSRYSLSIPFRTLDQHL